MARATASTRARRSALAGAARRCGASPTPRERAKAAVDGLEQRHFDLIGLIMVAAGVYCAFVLYLEWDGGRVGSWMETALEYTVGRVEYVVPLMVFGLGLALIARPMIRAPRALNVGAILVLLALLLAFAAGTLGLGPDRPVRDGYFEPRFYTTHGGAVGEALYWASTTLFQRLGAQILAVLMLLSGDPAADRDDDREPARQRRRRGAARARHDARDDADRAASGRAGRLGRAGRRRHPDHAGERDRERSSPSRSRTRRSGRTRTEPGARRAGAGRRSRRPTRRRGAGPRPRRPPEAKPSRAART